MTKKWLNKLALIALVATLTGCGKSNAGKSESSSNSRTAQSAKKSKSKSSAAAKASLNKELAKDKKSGQKQQTHRYALPQGPTWLHVYADGKDTGIALNPTKTVVAKLSEDQKVDFIGHLPMVGKVAYGAFPLSSEIADPNLDQAKVADKVISEVVYFQSGSNNVLTVTGLKAIAKRAFQDLPKYIAAHNAQDAAKLPNQTESLKNALGDDTDGTGQPKNTYQLQQLYFDKKTGDASNVDGVATYIAVMADDGVNKVSTNLHLELWAKAKSTPSGIYKGDSAPKTVMIKYDMAYQMQGNQWVLSDVSNQGSSDYAVTTTGKNWITQKY